MVRYVDETTIVSKLWKNCTSIEAEEQTAQKLATLKIKLHGELGGCWVKYRPLPAFKHGRENQAGLTILRI